MPAVFPRCRATARNLAISALSADLTTRALPNATRIQPPPPGGKEDLPGKWVPLAERLPGHCRRSAGLAPTPNALSPLSCGDPPPAEQPRGTQHPTLPSRWARRLPHFLLWLQRHGPLRRRGGLPEIGAGETIKKSLSVRNVAGVIPRPRISSTRLSRPWAGWGGAAPSGGRCFPGKDARLVTGPPGTSRGTRPARRPQP